nr:hypothetical protein [Pseudomonadota bacterium]
MTGDHIVPNTLSRNFRVPCITKLITAGFGLLLSLLAGPVLADGIPRPWGLGLQPPGSPIAARINSFHDVLLWVIIAISILVLL